VALGCRDAADCRIKLLSGAGLNHGSGGGRDDESRASTKKEANMPTGKRPPVRVTFPEEPPELTPAAAQALLKTLMKTYEEQITNEGRSGARLKRSVAADGPSAT
jgi:hypothetical protein